MECNGILKDIALAVLLAGTVHCAFSAGTDAATNGVDALFMGRRVKLEQGGVDLSANMRKAEDERLIPPHDPSDVFLDVNGETLTWRAVDRRIDLLLKNSPLPLPPEATIDEVERAVDIARFQYAKHLANRLVRDSVLAQMARDAGLSVSSNEVAAAVKTGLKGLEKKVGTEVLTDAIDPESCFYREQANYLLSKKYIDVVLSKTISVSPEEVQAAISNRNEEISTLTVSNAMMRPRMEAWLKEIRSGERDFGKTAYDFSDCPSSMDDGVMGDYSRDDGNLSKPLWEFAFAASTNELSDIVETGSTMHILKIVARRYGEDVGDDEYDDDDDSPSSGTNETAVASGVERPTSVTLAHIMLEKHEIPPVLDETSARKFVFKRKLGELNFKVRLAAFKAARIDCAVPVTLIKDTEKKARKIESLKNMKKEKNAK